MASGMQNVCWHTRHLPKGDTTSPGCMKELFTPTETWLLSTTSSCWERINSSLLLKTSGFFSNQCWPENKSIQLLILWSEKPWKKQHEVSIITGQMYRVFEFKAVWCLKLRFLSLMPNTQPKTSRSFFCRFMFEERIAAKPVQLAEEIITTFSDINRTYVSQYERFLVNMHDVMEFVNRTERSWQHIISFRQKAVSYLTNVSVTKAGVAADITSKQMEENIRQLELFVSEARSRSYIVVDSLSRLRVSYKALWHNMLTEPSTAKFYEKLHEDVTSAIQNKSVLDELTSTFKYMTKRSKQHFDKGSDPADLLVSMNADFAATSYQNKSNVISKEFKVKFFRTMHR